MRSIVRVQQKTIIKIKARIKGKNRMMKENKRDVKELESRALAAL